MAISSGFVLPTLFIGATYGRLVGLSCMNLFGPDVAEFMDPGMNDTNARSLVIG
jgi:H+/Cl- antiporter ClcA